MRIGQGADMVRQNRTPTDMRGITIRQEGIRVDDVRAASTSAAGEVAVAADAAESVGIAGAAQAVAAARPPGAGSASGAADP
ncbi:MAG: hypothetical protein CL858_00960 [Cupriavidus sp.]|nr:hypothetical protein [Cupriavidus sp.]